MRQYVSALLWIAATTAVVAAAQVITTRAAGERRAVTRLNIELVENTVRVRELEAELRTRAGMPELQRWNDAVFQMAAPQGGQILRSAVQLAAFAARPEAPPAVQYTVAQTGVPGAAPPTAPAAPEGARLVRTSFGETVAPASSAVEINSSEASDPSQPQDGAG